MIMIMYRRYHIKTKVAPPRASQPGKFTVKVDRLKFARMIAHELSECSSPKEMAATVKSRPCMYGVYSRPVGGMAPKSSQCVACYRCVIENPGIVRILPNPDLARQAEAFGLAPKQLSTLWYEAATGRVPVRGAGYNGPFSGPGFDAIWTDMSEIVRPTRDGIHGREFISTAVEIGSRPAFVRFGAEQEKAGASPLSLPIPMILDASAIPFLEVARAAAQAACELQTLAIVPAVALDSMEKLSHVVPCLALAELEKEPNRFTACAAVEVACTSSEEYRRAKKAFSGRIFVRLAVRPEVEKLVAELLESGAEVIHLCASSSDSNGTRQVSLRDALRGAHRELVQLQKRDRLTLIAGGAVVAAEHLPKAILCGADLVSLDLPLVIALQGATDAAAANNGTHFHFPAFDQNWARQRLVNLAGSWHAQLLEIMGAMGLREVRRLRGEVGRAIFADELEKEFCQTICGAQNG